MLFIGESRLSERFWRTNSARRKREVSVGELRSAVSVEQTWKDVFPSRAALSAWSLVARQEARKAPTTGVPGGELIGG
jgi:hypothetical protein